MIPPDELSHVLMILKAVLVGVTSFLGALMLLLGVVVKQQQLTKREAANRAGTKPQDQLTWQG